MIFSISVTLHDIVHTDKSLTLVFEYLERDLKQYMDDCGAILAMNNVKLFLYQVNSFFDVQSRQRAILNIKVNDNVNDVYFA